MHKTVRNLKWGRVEQTRGVEDAIKIHVARNFLVSYILYLRGGNEKRESLYSLARVYRRTYNTYLWRDANIYIYIIFNILSSDMLPNGLAITCI